MKRSLTIFFVAVGLVLPAWALDDAAPFGFTWGPLDKVPKPSFAMKDANVTVLLYRRDQSWVNEIPDTEIVLLDVCRTEGLQQVSWASRALSADEALSKFAQVVAQGVRKYGEAKSTAEGALAWNSGRVEALSVSEPDGKHRILMVSRGPDFGPCSAMHDSATDQNLRTRWLRRPDLPN